MRSKTKEINLTSGPQASPVILLESLRKGYVIFLYPSRTSPFHLYTLKPLICNNVWAGCHANACRYVIHSDSSSDHSSCMTAHEPCIAVYIYDKLAPTRVGAKHAPSFVRILCTLLLSGSTHAASRFSSVMKSY